MSVLCKKKVVHFKSESVSKVIQISFKTDSDLSQNWLRSDLLIQIWISFKSNLNHIWNWLGLEMYNRLDEEYWHLQRNGFTVPEKHFGAIYIYPLGIIFLSRVKVVFAILGFQARCTRKMTISFFGKTWIRGQFDPLFPEHDSLGQDLDAMEVFPGNREAISR